MRPFVRISFIALLSGAAFGQTAAAPPAFDIADVHVSPRSDWAKKAGPESDAGRPFERRQV